MKTSNQQSHEELTRSPQLYDNCRSRQHKQIYQPTDQYSGTLLRHGHVRLRFRSRCHWFLVPGRPHSAHGSKDHHAHPRPQWADPTLRTVQMPTRFSNMTVLAVKRAFFHQQKGGAIVRNKENAIAISIEFYGPAGLDGKSVEVEIVNCKSMQSAKLFLRGETFEVINLNHQEFEEFSGILRRVVKSTGRIDVASGSSIFDCF